MLAKHQTQYALHVLLLLPDLQYRQRSLLHCRETGATRLSRVIKASQSWVRDPEFEVRSCTCLASTEKDLDKPKAMNFTTNSRKLTAL